MVRLEGGSDFIRCVLALLLAAVVLGLAGESDRVSEGERRYQVAKVTAWLALEGDE